MSVVDETRGARPSGRMVALRLLASGPPVLVGAYLLAWAWRWPHSDIRNVWATAIGTVVLVVGVATYLATARWRRALVLTIVPALLAAALGLWALTVVTDGQESACGYRLDACSSILPGP